MESLIFGDIFRYNDTEYIYLAQTEDLTYAAKILNETVAQKIEGLYNKKECNGQMNPTAESNILYCYVILKTKEMKDKMAHFQQTKQDSTSLIQEKLPIRLNNDDLRNIKEEIISRSAIPLGLKEAVKDIRIET